MNVKPRSGMTFGSILLLGMVAVLAGNVGLTRAQSLDAPLQDLSFEVINATTGKPGTIDRLEIIHYTATGDKILDTRPQGSSFTLPRVPLFEDQAYLVKAWKNDVPYYWQIRGGKMREKTTTLHVFDTSDDLSDVVIDGLTMVVKQTESLLRLEYMISIDNAQRPQMTVMRDPGTLEVILPPGAADVEAEYLRGPDPTPVPVKSLGARVAVQAPLTSGGNRIKITAVAPWTDGMIFPLGFNLPVQAWSLLASPEYLDIRSFELEPDLDNEIPGHQRLLGPELDAGQRFEFRLVGRTAAEPGEDLFTAEAPGETDAAAGEDTTAARESGGPPFLLIIAGIVVGAIAVVLWRRRS